MSPKVTRFENVPCAISKCCGKATYTKKFGEDGEFYYCSQCKERCDVNTVTKRLAVDYFEKSYD